MQGFIITALLIIALPFFCHAGATTGNNKRFLDSKTLVRYYLPLYNVSFSIPQKGWLVYPLDGGGAKLIHEKFGSQINVNSYGMNSAVNVNLTSAFWEKKTIQQFQNDYGDFALDKTKNFEDGFNISFHYNKNGGVFAGLNVIKKLEGQFFQVTCAAPKDIFLKTYYACQKITETLEATEYQVQKNDLRSSYEWTSQFSALELENLAWLALKEIQKKSDDADVVRNWMAVSLVEQYFRPTQERNYDLISDIKANPVSSGAVRNLAASLLGESINCNPDTKGKLDELILFGLACEKMRTSLVAKLLYQRESALAHYLLGQTAIKLNDLQGAHEHLTRAEFITPKNEFILFELAKLNLKNGKTYEAISFLETAYSINPNIEAIKLELIRLYSKVGLDDKVHLLMDEIEMSGASAQLSDVYLESGRNYLKNDEYEMAISLFNKAIESNPKNDKAHYELAQVYLYNKTDQAKAIEHLERYLALTADKHDTQKIFALITKLKAKD